MLNLPRISGTHLYIPGTTHSLIDKFSSKEKRYSYITQIEYETCFEMQKDKYFKKYKFDAAGDAILICCV